MLIELHKCLMHYNKSIQEMWKILIDKDMTKMELCKLADISTYTMTKLGKGQTVTTEVLVKICNALDCDFGDIMEIVEERSL